MFHPSASPLCFTRSVHWVTQPSDFPSLTPPPPLPLYFSALWCGVVWCGVVFQEDLFRRFSTYLPANFIFGLAFLGISWQILEPVRYLNPLATLLLLTGPTIAASKKFTDICLYQV